MNILVIKISVIPFLAIVSFANAQGIDVGSGPVSFQVTVFTGKKAKNTTLPTNVLFSDPLFKKPTVLVFTREISKELGTYLHNFEDIVTENNMVAAVIFLQDEKSPTRLEDHAEQWKYDHVTLTEYSGANGPPEFAIPKDVEVKVVMSVENTIKVNKMFANLKDFADAIPDLLNDSFTILE